MDVVQIVQADQDGGQQLLGPRNTLVHGTGATRAGVDDLVGGVSSERWLTSGFSWCQCPRMRELRLCGALQGDGVTVLRTMRVLSQTRLRTLDLRLDGTESTNLEGHAGAMTVAVSVEPGAAAHVLSAAPVQAHAAWTWDATWCASWS